MNVIYWEVQLINRIQLISKINISVCSGRMIYGLIIYGCNYSWVPINLDFRDVVYVIDGFCTQPICSWNVGVFSQWITFFSTHKSSVEHIWHIPLVNWPIIIFSSSNCQWAMYRDKSRIEGNNSRINVERPLQFMTWFLKNLPLLAHGNLENINVLQVRGLYCFEI